MLRIISVCFTLLSIVQAETLNSIISHSLETHNSLKAIEQRLSGLDESYKLTQNFQNPTISFTIGDIQFSDPMNRSIEPMQFTSINFQQKIPYFGKRDAKGSLVHAQKSVVLSSLEAAKVALCREIKLTAYTIWEYERKLSIIDEHIELSRKNIELSNVYSSSGNAPPYGSYEYKTFTLPAKNKKKRYKKYARSFVL